MAFTIDIFYFTTGNTYILKSTYLYPILFTSSTSAYSTHRFVRTVNIRNIYGLANLKMFKMLCLIYWNIFVTKQSQVALIYFITYTSRIR